MVDFAKKQNLMAIAITDHSRGMPGSPNDWYFKNMNVLPKVIEDIYFLKGVEVNVCDQTGYLDMDNFTMSCLNWVVASMHEETLFQFRFDFEACTNAWLNVAKSPYVNVIGHSGMEEFKYDYEKVIPEFGKNGKLVEINNNSFRIRRGSSTNCKKIAELCKKHKVPVVLNSDAHCAFQVGNMENSIKMLNEIDFPEELIVNANEQRFVNYLKQYTNYFS
jgi:putative hydrolase